MECPKCTHNNILSRVKVLATNIMLRICNGCQRTWIDGENPKKAQAIRLSDFLNAKGINSYDLIEVAEEYVKKAG